MRAAVSFRKHKLDSHLDGLSNRPSANPWPSGLCTWVRGVMNIDLLPLFITCQYTPERNSIPDIAKAKHDLAVLHSPLA